MKRSLTFRIVVLDFLIVFYNNPPWSWSFDKMLNVFWEVVHHLKSFVQVLLVSLTQKLTQVDS